MNLLKFCHYRDILGIINISISYAMRDNDANNMTNPPPPPTPYLLCHFKNLDKIDSFLKNVLNVFEGKKLDYIFEEPPNLYLIVFLVSFFSLLL